MKPVALSFLFTIIAALATTAQNAVVTAEDLAALEGSKWTGTLSYVDYSSNKKTSIKSALLVKKSADKSNTWIFDYEYPDEPKANGSSVITLADGGKIFNEQIVVEKVAGNAEAPMRIVTTKPGTDNDKKALFRYTYLVSRRSLTIKKEVQLDGSSEWFERNTYAWTR